MHQQYVIDCNTRVLPREEIHQAETSNQIHSADRLGQFLAWLLFAQTRPTRKLEHNTISAELKGPRQLSRIRLEIVDLGPRTAPKPDEAKPKMPGAVPTNRRKAIPIDFGPVSGCFDHDPKLLNCEIPALAK